MSEYFIHPTLGSDAHAGLAPDAPWKTFAPLARITLGPGDHVELLAPGPIDHTLHLRGAGTDAQPIQLRFAPGRYDIHPDHLTARQLHISNCNDQQDQPKPLALFIDHARHVNIHGQGALLVCRAKMIQLGLDHAQSIRVTGLTFDYHRPTVSEWTVTAAGPDWAELAIHPDSTYQIDGSAVQWLGEGWSYRTGLAQQLNPDTHDVRRRKDPLPSMLLQQISPGHLRATGTHDMIAGQVFQLRNTLRDGCGTLIAHSSDIVFDDVHFAFIHGMGVVAQYSQDITMNRVRIEPRAGSGRTTAAWADCMHFSGCRGMVTIDQCNFNGAHDDAINIHGTYLRIVGQPAADQIRVAFMHRQTFGFQAFFPGDEIEFVRAGSMQSYASARIRGVQMPDDREQLLQLDAAVPAWMENDVVENVTWTPGVRISRCTVMRIPTRGFLLTTRQPVVVTDNTFVRTSHGIQVSGDTSSWFESGCVRDMLICHNHFVRPKRAAVSIQPENHQPNPAVHRNIRIRDNQIQLDADALALQAKGVTGLSFTGNVITADPAVPLDQRIVVTDCRDTTMNALGMMRG